MQVVIRIDLAVTGLRHRRDICHAEIELSHRAVRKLHTDLAESGKPVFKEPD